MKKDLSMTVRLETTLGEVVIKLASEDDRSIGYVLRQLILEALEARKIDVSFREKSPTYGIAACAAEIQPVEPVGKAMKSAAKSKVKAVKRRKGKK